ncbi:hypothetical protein [Microcella frigidaquae]|uniref:7-cyano-7-deazaguanine synthase (Queuosine biosynthesis) n=1 Tax=Microcella frigidaquae TaxID=424758 RepID=A0A840XCI4_9MICO|nr:hypothetical protein [Microcella frigidaquae]MBB5618745.1 hypothetical protein [Microcella frigidaquae]NHN44176.1 hypothetical protein [Microcella frigidaquae]
MPSPSQRDGVEVSPVRFPHPNRLEFDVAVRGEVTTVWFEADRPVARSAAPVLPAVLPVAMRVGAPLELLDEHDAVAIENAARAAQTLHGWFSDLTPVAVAARAATIDDRSAGGVGCFFSGGVDSYFSALQHLNEVSHLIFVHGFDIEIADEALAAKAISEARSAAAELDRELIVVRTNVRALSEPHVAWGDCYHGAALAAVAHLLGNDLGRVIVPASYHVSDLFPWGSHPDLDPWWSSSRLTLVHHGEEFTRPQKVAAIATSPVAMAHLRVCWENQGGRYNCGQCEKCVRTMINLRAAGALERCATLPNTIDIAGVRDVRTDHGVVLFARENIAAMRESGAFDRELERALRSLISRARMEEIRHRLHRWVARR